MQIIFAAAIGRNGSQNLVEVFNRFGIDCIGEHEPPDLPLRQIGYRPIFRKLGWFGPSSRAAMIGRNFQRRYIAPDVMMGRGEALQWVDRGERDKIAELAAKRVARIRRFERRGYRHYLEAGPYFLFTYGPETYPLIPHLRLIKLTRDPISNAKSFVNREKNIFKNSLPPDRPSNILRIANWQNLSQFQLYLHRWFEAELKFRAFVDDHEPSKIHYMRTEDLSNPAKIMELFSYFHIEHRPIKELSPTNTAGEHHKRATHITDSDIHEYEQFIGLVPPDLLDRIDHLKTYDPCGLAQSLLARPVSQRAAGG